MLLTCDDRPPNPIGPTPESVLGLTPSRTPELKNGSPLEPVPRFEPGLKFGILLKVRVSSPLELELVFELERIPPEKLIVSPLRKFDKSD
jgi:hypothetical protein